MKPLSFFLLICLYASQLRAQFKYDNVAYRTIYLEDLCKELKQQPGVLLLDVRSPGEFNDTSMYENLRIGRLKGAVNIDINEFAGRMNELPKDKNQPIFLYCSHSQRSRRCSKTLADSGYKNVYNINGGMTELNMLRNNGYPCLNDIYETSNPFNTLSPERASTLIADNKDLFILDVRNDSAYKGIAGSEKLNAMGRLKGSVNIPIAQLPDQLKKVPTHKQLLIVDSYGDESVQAATLLAKKGYKDLNIVFNGLDNWMSEDDREFKEKNHWWTSPVNYGTISADELGNVLSKNQDALILDIRTKDEFNNSVRDRTWMNKGHIQNAVNIPLGELKERMNEIIAYKNKDVIVYGFGSSPDAFSSAKLLADNGFARIKLLANGLFGLRWRAANIKGKQDLMKLVVDVPAENM